MEKFKCHFKNCVPNTNSQMITNLILRNPKTHAHDENEEKLSTQKFMSMRFKMRKFNFVGLKKKLSKEI